MRIVLKLTKNNASVPFEHHSILAGALHKWVNDAQIHDNLSLYSFSGLRGGIARKEYLDFPKSGNWFISVYDTTLLMKIIKKIQLQPAIAYGMSVSEVVFCKEPLFVTEQRFMLARPIFIKRTIENKVRHYLYTDEEADTLMTETMHNKLKSIGIADPSLSIMFDRSYENAKIKLISYKGIKNKVNWCPIIIKGKPETIQFAWNVGIGNSTGIGFGSLI